MSFLANCLSRHEGFFSAFSYACTSVCILIFNKMVLTTYKFNFPVIMTLFHMSVCVLVLSALRRGKMLNYASFDWVLARKAMPLSLCFVANIVVGMVALRATDIPMFATLRRLTVVFVLLNEWAMLGKRPTWSVSSSVSIMILGSLIGGWGDLHFDLVGYLFVLLNNGITALNLVLMKKTIGDTKLAGDKLGLMYYNSLLAIPPLVIIALLNGEAWRITSFPSLGNVGFQMAFTISAIMSFLMNYSTFWCTAVNSALTTSVTGQVKNVLSSFVSVAAFGVTATPTLLFGLSVGLSGSMLYGYVTFINNKQVSAEKDKVHKSRYAGKTQLEEGGGSGPSTSPKLMSSRPASPQLSSQYSLSSTQSNEGQMALNGSYNHSVANGSNGNDVGDNNSSMSATLSALITNAASSISSTTNNIMSDAAHRI